MENPLSQKAFSERIKEKTAAERQELERLMKIELEMLAEGLRKESAAVLTTTVTAIRRESSALSLATEEMLREQQRQLDAIRRRAWITLIVPAMVALSLCLGIWLGSWGLMRYQAAEIIRQQQVLADLEARGGKVEIRNCGDARRSRLCVKIDPTAPEYQDGYRILSGH